MRHSAHLAAILLFGFAGRVIAQQSPATQGPVAPAPDVFNARVQPIAGAHADAVANGPKRKATYTVEVDAAAGWVDTQIPLLPGDEVKFLAKGSTLLSNGQTATADGVERGWRDMLRAFPLESGKVGALLGRVGDGEAAVPFVIGTEMSLKVRRAGDLFVCANVGGDLSTTGRLRLTVKFETSSRNASENAPPKVSDLRQLLQASTMDALPRRVADQDGTPGDVVNFALIGTEQEVTEAFARSGWVEVDADTNTALLHGLLSTLQRQAYLQVPMSKLYLFGRAQDHSFARAEAIKVATERHHLRLWRTDEVVDGRALWAGSATFDNGLEKDERNGRMTHSIDPEVDRERAFLLASFDSSGSFSSAAYVLPLEPMHEAHTATGGSFHTDGRVLVMALK